jgi:hypothetical protein
MSTAFVLGNGVSRKNINLALLHEHGKLYGCNALYREYTPDVLVATDRPIATAIQDSGYPLNNQFYTRRPIEGKGANKIPQPYFGYSSGPVAVSLAALQGHNIIYLLGFDMGPIKNNQFNNVYAGTEFYKPPASAPTFTGNWIKQLVQIAKDFPQCKIIRVHGPTTASVENFEKIENFQAIDLNSFCASFGIACQATK